MEPLVWDRFCYGWILGGILPWMVNCSWLTDYTVLTAITVHRYTAPWDDLKCKKIQCREASLS